ncbi:FGGY-family carbohydrate kinase [Helcobacillus massiliensis]|uniref:FGGY-family carbohydrate kinase n=1 Tax=Helcobacillus massiliensis TaxID=521392 RepID=UPI002554F2BF|nr:FGGY-family carbohydrate kinase [Helcobacillus massiliensis]MDK7742649.1 FGGY-family carbohydrate kinase [Helcobacillus massiliensis]WOO92587.1 FGGY-family carbohydrate kinase [Helcobacillus massiliensis]
MTRSPAVSRTAPVVFGIDIGTSSTKGVLVTPTGEIIAQAVREHEVQRPAPGHVEMDAETWWQELRDIAAELIDPQADDVLAVGVSGMGPCTVLADANGAPTRPAILYGVDTRSTDQIAALNDRFGSDEILRLGGSRLSSQAAGPKIQWVRDNEPDVFERSSRLFMAASFLAHRLTGAYVLDHHSASQATPLYRADDQQWSNEHWDQVAPGIEQPRLLWAGERAGEVTAAAAEQVPGLREGTPVIAGSIDAWTEAVSVGGHHPGDLFLMYGTTFFLIATADRPMRSETMWGTAGAFCDTWSLAGGMATSGAITNWLRDLVSTGEDRADWAQLIAEAEASPPGAHGLLLLPYFAGERTPIQDPEARGVLAGLTVSHTRGDVYRAVLEATAFAVRHNLEALREAGIEVTRVVAAGGGTQGGLWTQIVSDVTGLTQVIPTTTIGASYGAAFLAVQMLADSPNAPVAPPRIEDWNPPARIEEPNPGAHRHYSQMYELYLELHRSTEVIQHSLAALQALSDR